MARPRDIRRLAFEALFQLDAGEGGNMDAVRAWVDDHAKSEEGVVFDARDRRKAMTTAQGAWSSRREADEAFRALSPEWPAHRMPAPDRAVLRLAHYEMTKTETEPKAVVNEAIELAKTYGTERSPGFVNALLDAILKQVLATRAIASAAPASDEGAA